MKTRDKLIQTKGYWMTTIQNNLYACVEDYMKSKGINRTQLAQELGVTKGYISQVLNGDFNGRLSKLVELALAIDTVPLIDFHDKEDYIENDRAGLYNINQNGHYTIKFSMQYHQLEQFKNRVQVSSNDKKISGSLFCDHTPVKLSYEQA